MLFVLGGGLSTIATIGEDIKNLQLRAIFGFASSYPGRNKPFILH
jgi:hypothetical protein